MRVKCQRSTSVYVRSKVYSGVSIVELIIVIAIVIILAVSALSFGSGFLVRNNLTNDTNEVISSLRTAQINAMSGKGNGKWGVKIDMNTRQITLFQGDSYDLRNSAFDQVFEIAGQVSITEGEIVFDKNTGNPSATLTLTVNSSQGDSNTVSVNEVGIVDVL